MVLSNPFNMLKAIINVATPSAIPAMEIPDINEINFEPFFENINRFEI
jgi:hypothetical protein